MQQVLNDATDKARMLETENRNESTWSTRSKEKKIERILQKEILITEQGETRIFDILNSILCSR